MNRYDPIWLPLFGSVLGLGLLLVARHVPEIVETLSWVLISVGLFCVGYWLIVVNVVDWQIDRRQRESEQ